MVGPAWMIGFGLDFGCEKPEHANAPIVQHYVMRNREEKYTQ